MRIILNKFKSIHLTVDKGEEATQSGPTEVWARRCGLVMGVLGQLARILYSNLNCLLVKFMLLTITLYLQRTGG